jgi:hypothetical protein
VHVHVGFVWFVLLVRLEKKGATRRYAHVFCERDLGFLVSCLGLIC